MKDYYQILETDKRATPEEIKRAYRKLAKKYHPDRSGYEHADKLFAQINEAYEVIGDPERKKEYDLKKEQPPTPRFSQGYQRSHRSPPRYKQQVKLNLTPYLRYFKMVSKVALAFCILLIFDYALPSPSYNDMVMGKTGQISLSRSGRQYLTGYYIKLQQQGTFLIDKELGVRVTRGLPVSVNKTILFNKLKTVSFNFGAEHFEYSIGASIYSNFSFALIVLTLTSLVGAFRKNKPEVALNLAIINGFLTILVIYFLAIS